MAKTVLPKNWLIAILIAVGVMVFASNGLKGGPEVSAREAIALLNSSPRPVVIDVRERAEYDQGHVPGALSVPLSELKQRLAGLNLSKTDPVVVYCGEGGACGPDATRQLIESGYFGALTLKGGIDGWRAAGQPVTTK